MQHTCTIDNAPRMLDWILHRGGIAVWRSVNLSNPSASWSTPALTDGKPTPKPTWQAANEPELVTNAADVTVSEDHEVRRFHVAVKRGDSLNFVCTDASTRKIRSAVEKAGDGAYYVFDYSTQEAVIMAPSRTLSLADWAKESALVPA